MQIEVPGLFDLQVNGFGGVDFNDPMTTPEAVLQAVARLRERGVTRFLPTPGNLFFGTFCPVCEATAPSQCTPGASLASG